MSAQAFHGGRLADAARAFDRTPETFIDFSTNLNVWAPEIDAGEWAKMRGDALYYPEASSDDLRRRLSDVYQVHEDFIVPTSGGIEALYLAVRLFAGQKIAVLEPSFSDYTRSVRAAGDSPESIVLAEEEWHAPMMEFCERFAEHDVIIIGNPNNPTGACASRKEMLQLISHPSMIGKKWIIDEAFAEFTSGDTELLPALRECDNVIVLRSLTKSWRIPGLRLGFLATGSKAWREQIEAMQPPWSVNAPVQAWARRYLTRENHEAILERLSGLTEVRAQFAEKLSELDGLKVYSSSANFILIQLDDAWPRASELYQLLGRRGFLIRVADSFTGLESGRFIRLAVRTPEENNQLIEAFEGCRVCVEEEATA